MLMDNSYRNNQSSSDQYAYHSYYNSQHSSPEASQAQAVHQQMYTNYRDHVLDNGQASPWSQSDSMSWNSPQTPPESQPHQRCRSMMPPRPKLSTHLWEDEGTICYQVDARSICVARRQDNDMVNGTKLLNVVGMSRGKRDGILKNEKGRVVVKVGSMHLKGVWITFARATALAAQYKIIDMLYPLFVDDPSMFLYMSPLATGTSASQFPHFAGHYRNHPCLNTFNNSSWDRQHQHEGSQLENRSTMFPVSGKSLKLDTRESSSSRLSMHSHNEVDFLSTGMEYRNPSSANENSYNNGSAPEMAVGGLVRASSDDYADHYSQMPSGAPPDQGFDNGSFSSNQHTAYPQAGLPPLLNTRPKSQAFQQDNGEINDTSGSILGKSSGLRTASIYMPLPLAPASPNSIKNGNHSVGSAPAYDHSLPPVVGSQQTEYYLWGGVTNFQNNKDGHGYENRSSGTVDLCFFVG